MVLLSTLFNARWIILAAGVFAAGWSVNGWRLNAEIERIKAGHAEQVAAAAKQNASALAEMVRKKDEAIAQANKRAQINARNAAINDDTVDSLRDQLRAANSRLPEATAEAARNYAATLSDVFGQCTRRLAELAKAADGHASDVQTLIDAP